MAAKKSLNKSKKEAPIKTKEDFENLLSQEIGRFYLSFLGDAPAIKGKVIFTKNEAEKNYFMLLAHAIDMLNSSKTSRERRDAANAALTLSIIPFRVH